MENMKGNITTIIKFIVMSIAPAVGIAEATQDQITTLLVAAIGLILAYFDAKYTNTLFNNPDNDNEEPTMEWVNCRCTAPTFNNLNNDKEDDDDNAA